MTLLSFVLIIIAFGAGVLLILLTIAALAGAFGRPSRRTPEEVANYLRNFIEGGGSPHDWDDFESVPIEDPTLDGIRCEAVKAAPPNPDMNRLRELLRQAEAIADRDRGAAKPG